MRHAAEEEWGKCRAGEAVDVPRTQGEGGDTATGEYYFYRSLFSSDFLTIFTHLFLHMMRRGVVVPGMGEAGAPVIG